jgi:hypothetical protein
MHAVGAARALLFHGRPPFNREILDWSAKRTKPDI